MTKTFFADSAALMSPRTASYVAAMVREGDSFDYDTWLKEVREEEAQAKQVVAVNTSGTLTTGQIADAIEALNVQPRTLPLISNTIPGPRTARWPPRQAQLPTSKNAWLRRWLERVRLAWEDFQSSRRRDAVYGYLEAVSAIVMHFGVRRRTKRLLRHAFEFANLPFDKNADPFSAVIRCTSGGDVDNKTISKWSRALRYVARFKEPDSVLRTFMKEAGGINACAERYTKHFGRGHRRQHTSI